ncbi:hypothetical protein AWB76_07556 [Caballeronia temeraria]|uniref:Uncharacterized protein n=1 Tax=Caballeronia temeraria TaxID=1777137 RepID=A0A158DVM4_9BURK|nr:hypothetical protein [Caballeronia temeraria]SAK98604.1 hypothetical protein AWB76_07556 [Caballeronia temeraria]
MMSMRFLTFAIALALTSAASPQTLDVGALSFTKPELRLGIPSGGPKLQGAPIAAPPPQVVQAPPDGRDIKLGYGFDPLTGAVRQYLCILEDRRTPDSAQLRPQGSKDDTTVQFLDGDVTTTVSTNMSSHRSSSGQSADFSLTYKAFTFGADMAESDENYFNRIDAFGRIHGQYITKTEARVGGVWGRNVEKLATASDKTTFKNLCGTYFISGIQSGSLIDEVFRLAIKSSSRSSSDTSKAQAGLAQLFSIGVTSKDAEQDVAGVATVFVSPRSKGVPASGVGAVAIGSSGTVNPAAVRAAAVYATNDWKTAVAGSMLGNQLPLKVTITPYSALPYLPGASKITSPSMVLMTKIENTSFLHNELFTNILTLRRAIAMDDEQYNAFFSTPKASVANLLKQATCLREEFVAQVQTCDDALQKGSDDTPACQNLNVLTPEKVQAVTLAPAPASGAAPPVAASMPVFCRS